MKSSRPTSICQACFACHWSALSFTNRIGGRWRRWSCWRLVIASNDVQDPGPGRRSTCTDPARAFCDIRGAFGIGLSYSSPMVYCRSSVCLLDMHRILSVTPIGEHESLVHFAADKSWSTVIRSALLRSRVKMLQTTMGSDEQHICSSSLSLHGGQPTPEFRLIFAKDGGHR